jgi:hypothetical protein
MRSILAWFVALGMVGAALAGCGGSNGTPLGPGSNPNGQQGVPPVNNSSFQLRVLNATPDFGAIDVYVDGARTWQNVKYGAFGTTASVTNAPFYVNVQPAAHNVAVVAAGATLSNATQQATATTSNTIARTTIVVADKVFGTLTTPALVALAFPEPTLVAPTTAVNVVLHHGAPSGAPGSIAFGSLAAAASSSTFPAGSLTIPTFINILTFGNPPSTASEFKLPFVNSGGAPIGYYVANTGAANQTTPIGCFAPGGPPASQPTSGAPCVVSQFLQLTGAYPTPPPPVPGQTSLPPDSGNTLPSTNTELDPNNLSIYAVDTAPPPGSTTPGVGLIGVFDPSQI